MLPLKLLRVINPAFPKNNIFRAQAKQMVSFGAVVLTTAAEKFCIENDQP